jgi:hypothetical protein
MMRNKTDRIFIDIKANMRIFVSTLKNNTL